MAIDLGTPTRSDALESLPVTTVFTRKILKMGSKIVFFKKGGRAIFSRQIYFRIIYYLSTAIGIFPFFLQRTHYITSYLAGILSLIAVTLVGYSSIFINYCFFYDMPVDEKLVKSMEIVLVACVLSTHSILFVISAGTSPWRVRAVRQIIKDLEEVDTMLSNRFRKDYNFQDFLCCLLNVLLITWEAYIYTNFTFRLFYIAITINFWLTSSQFSVLARLISNRLQDACESLNELKKTIHLSYEQQKVAILSEAHDKLCDASDTLQSSFGLLVTFVIIITFMGLTVVTFYLYNSSNFLRVFNIMHGFTGPNRAPLEKVLWMIYIISISWNIAASSYELTEKTKEFNHLLYQLMINDKSSELMRNEKLLLHLSMKREVVMTACGLFNLDFGLLHSMVAAASTYLVMLIQVGQQD